MAASFSPPKPDPQALWVSLQVNPLPHPGLCPPLYKNVGPLLTAFRTLVLWTEIEVASLALEGIVLASGLLQKSQVNGPCVEFPPGSSKGVWSAIRGASRPSSRSRMAQEKLGCRLGKACCLFSPDSESTVESPRTLLGPKMLADFTTCTQPLGQQWPTPSQHHPGDTSLLQTLFPKRC